MDPAPLVLWGVAAQKEENENLAAEVHFLR
jgi:hypothetical protein